MPEPLSADDVRHVARLARLRLSAEEIEGYRSELSAVLDHLATIAELDVEGVAPLNHPLDVTNRLADDRVEDGMPIEDLLANAPAVEGPYLAVPKVLDAD